LAVESIPAAASQKNWRDILANDSCKDDLECKPQTRHWLSVVAPHLRPDRPFSWYQYGQVFNYFNSHIQISFPDSIVNLFHLKQRRIVRPIESQHEQSGISSIPLVKIQSAVNFDGEMALYMKSLPQYFGNKKFSFSYNEQVNDIHFHTFSVVSALH